MAAAPPAMPGKGRGLCGAGRALPGAAPPPAPAQPQHGAARLGMAGLRYPQHGGHCRAAAAMNLLLGVFHVLLPCFRPGEAQGQGERRGGAPAAAAAAAAGVIAAAAAAGGRAGPPPPSPGRCRGGSPGTQRRAAAAGPVPPGGGYMCGFSLCPQPSSPSPAWWSCGRPRRASSCCPRR